MLTVNLSGIKWVYEQGANSGHLEEVGRDRDLVREESNTSTICLRDQKFQTLHDRSPDINATIGSSSRQQ